MGTTESFEFLNELALSAGVECLCWPVENPWTYYGSVEPGGAMDPNPDCPQHFPNESLETKS